MSGITAPALLLLARQRNHISSSQLTDCGIGRHERDRLVADGLLMHVSKSVFCVPGCRIDLEARLIQLCLQHPAGYVTSVTAGGLLGVRRMPRTSPVIFGVPHGSRVELPSWARLRQTTVLPAQHVRTLDSGIRVAAPARLAFDLSADLSFTSLTSIVEQLLHERRVAEGELIDIARLLCSSTRPGSRKFAAVLLRRAGRAPSESHPEVRTLHGLLARGVPVVPQVRHLALPNGSSVRMDMAVESVRWAVEVDAHPEHFSMLGSTADRRRDRQLHMIDWQVERVTPIDLLASDQCFDELAEAYRARQAVIAGRRKPA